MNKKILTLIQMIYIITISIASYCLYKSLSPFSFWLTILIGILSFLILNMIYHNVLNMITINRKKIISCYFIFLVMNTIIFLFFSINCWKNELFLLFIIQILSGVFFSLFIRKEQDKVKWIFSLILLSIFNFISFSSMSLNTIMIPFVVNLSLYITTLFDDLAIYRKKNYIFTFLIGFFLSLVFEISALTILNMLFLLFIISRKRGIKSAIKLSPAMLIGYIILPIAKVSWLPIKDITMNNVSIYLLLILITISVIGTIYSFYHKERKMGYLCRGFVLLFFLLAFLLKSEQIVIVNSMIPVFLLLILTIYENIPQVYEQKISINKKWIKPQQKGCEKVSVVVPNYNYENYLVERIDSILNQSYKISELIILDDVSKDNSVKVIEEKIKDIKKKYPNLPVKFLPNKKNSGVFAQWRKCFEVSNGDYVWICEADDSAHPKLLEKAMNAFKDPNVILSYTESLTIDENNKLLMSNLREWIDIFHTEKWNKDYIETGKKEIESTLCINNTIANVSSVIFKRRKDIPYEKYLKEAEDFKLSGDWYFYAKVLEHGSLSYNHKSLNYHRMHSKSVTLTTKGDLHYLEVLKIQNMIMNNHKLSNDVLEKIDIYRSMLKRRFMLGEEEIRLLEIPFEEILKKSKVKDEVLLSIIVPVYNTEKYLRKCLDSVLVKIPPKTEIIIVNDGSPDNSKSIIDEYEKNYPNIVFGHHKKNGGLSSAKNYGKKFSKGRYIIYLDSDDYVAPNMYITMLKKALETNADIVYCDMVEDFDNGERIFFSMKNYDREDEFLQLVDNPLMATSCNKLIKRDLMKDLEYPEGKNNEDLATNPILFEKAKIIEHVDSPFYFYYQRTGSIQNSAFNEKRFVIFEAIKNCFEHLEKINAKHITEIKGSIYTHQIIGLLIFIICKQKRKERMKYYKLFCDYIEEFEDIETNPYVKEYLKEYHLTKLLHYIKMKNIKKLDLYLQIKMR